MPHRLTEPEFVLKSTPPRAGKLVVGRDRLNLNAPGIREGQVLLLQAPAGFGKTALLAQWRRQWLQRGISAAWLTLDERDDRMRLISAIRYAVRMAAPKLSQSAQEAGSASDAMAAATRCLAEVASMAMPLALILDDIHTLQDPDARSLLAYIVCNAPANLTLALASRTRIELPAAKRSGNTAWITLDAHTLRMTSKESTAALSMRFGKGVDKDLAARLHATSEGWALGLQLMSSSIEQGTDASHALELAERAAQGMEQYFTEFLLNRLSPAAVDLLLRISLVDVIHPGLCIALTGRPESAGELEQLRGSTPVLGATIGSDWMKMHPLAREVLRARATEKLSPAELQLVHERAVEWLARRGLDEQAAHHALAAGHADRAYELAERCLYALAVNGHLGRVQAQLDRMPPAVVIARPRLALASAFVKCVGETSTQAREMLAALLARADLPADVRQEAAAAAVPVEFIADNFDRAAELRAELAKTYPTGDLGLDQRIQNQAAYLLLFSGSPHLARHYCNAAVREDVAQDLYSRQFRRTYIVSLSYLWEGQVNLAADALNLISQDSQLKLGRRHKHSTLLDSTLAAAMWELDRPETAASLLADRLDVLAAAGLPDAVSRGFITASRVAGWEGHDAKRLHLLDYLCTLGEARRWPRVTLEALAELIAVHARAGHVKSSVGLLPRAMAAHAAALQQNPKTLAPLLELRLHLCWTYACIVNRELHEAQRHLEALASLAVTLRCGREDIECKLLQALVMHQFGKDARELLRETTDLANVLGLKRIAIDTHPGLLSLLPPSSPPVQAGDAPFARRDPMPEVRRETTVAPTELLTPKEREILGLMSQGLQNKEIATASGVGQETVKWHIKNLFAKLGAANRRHAVARARMFGLLAAED